VASTSPSREDALWAIRYRLDHSHEIPHGSLFASMRDDIVALLEIVEELEDERRT
jgi:hypothetical protein